MKNLLGKRTAQKINLGAMLICSLVCFCVSAQDAIDAASAERQRQIEEHKKAIQSLEYKDEYEKARAKALKKLQNIQRLQQQMEEANQDEVKTKPTETTAPQPVKEEPQKPVTPAPKPQPVHPAPQPTQPQVVQPKKAAQPAKTAANPTNPPPKKVVKTATAAVKPQPAKVAPQQQKTQSGLNVLAPLFAQTKPSAVPAPAPLNVIASNVPQLGKIRFIVREKKRYLNVADVAAYYKMQYAYSTEKAVLFSTAHRMTFEKGKRDCTIDKTTVTLLFAVIFEKNQFYLSEMDFIKVLTPAFRTKLPFRKTKLIMIDAGHGGSDPGAPGPIYAEKIINLQIALKLRDRLKACGFDVVMTRSNDSKMTLQQRVQKSELFKPDLFISVHCNSTTNKAISGVETWLVAPCGGQSAKESAVKTTLDPGNQFDSYNFRLAYEIQRAMKRFFPKRIDRGVKHSRFFVLCNSTAPAVLLEVGYLSNLAEGKILATTAEQDKIVNAILSGLASYINIIK